MRAAEIMTRNVVTATPETEIHDIASLMVNHRARCVPVLHGGRLVGIISESDLLRRVETNSGRTHSVLSDLFASASSRAREYVRTHSRRAGDLMTRDVVTVRETAGVADIARLLEERRLRQVLVVDDDGHLLGVVARANLVEAVARAGLPDASNDDNAIRDKLLAELRSQSWADGARLAQVVVADGVVYLWGHVELADVRKAMVVAAENIPGVKRVDDRLASAATFDPLARPYWTDAPPG